MSKIEISSGIPIPRRNANGEFEAIPWNKLSVGDSFVFPSASKSCVSNACHYRSKGSGKRFCMRTVKNENGEKQFRVWRVK